MAYDERALHGVGGWLALLIIGLGIFSPLRMVIEAIGIWSLQPAQVPGFAANLFAFQLVESAVIAARTGGSLYLAWRLYAVHRPDTVQIVLRGLWVLALGIPLVEVALVVLVTGLPIGTIVGGGLAAIVQGLLFAGIWTAYLLRSRRVANTYTPDHDSADVFA